MKERTKERNGDTLRCLTTLPPITQSAQKEEGPDCIHVDTPSAAVAENFSEYALYSTEGRPRLMGWMPPLRIYTVWIQGQTTCRSLKYEPVSFYGCQSRRHCYWQRVFNSHYQLRVMLLSKTLCQQLRTLHTQMAQELRKYVVVWFMLQQETNVLLFTCKLCQVKC